MAPNNISPDLANLLALVFEWGVYGASLPFFGVTLHELFRREKGEKINKTLVFVALALWLLSTTTLVGDTTNTFLRFTTFRDVPDYFQQVAGRPAMILRGFAYMCITILADAVVVYRCFVVWRSSHWVVRFIPWLLWFGLIAAGVSCWVTLFTARPENAPSMYRLTKFTTAFFAASLVANLLSTGLLAYKIWRITDALSASNSTLRKLARVVIDSGVIYTASLVIALIVLLSGSNLYYVTTYIISGIVSITFYLTIIRIQRSNRKRFSVRSVFDCEDRVLRGLEIPRTRPHGQSIGISRQSQSSKVDENGQWSEDSAHG